SRHRSNAHSQRRNSKRRDGVRASRRAGPRSWWALCARRFATTSSKRDPILFYSLDNLRAHSARRDANKIPHRLIAVVIDKRNSTDVDFYRATRTQNSRGSTTLRRNVECSPEVTTGTAGQDAEFDVFAGRKDSIRDFRDRAITAARDDEFLSFARRFTRQRRRIATLLREDGSECSELRSQIARNLRPHFASAATGRRRINDHYRHVRFV